MSNRPKLVGYAAVWGAVGKTPRYGLHERIAPGAFADSIVFDPIRALWMHNGYLELAFNGNAKRGEGLLSLREDSFGLAFRNGALRKPGMDRLCDFSNP